jgi:hypothetical protein
LGTTLYNEINQESKIKKIRDNVYYGSSMHFFKKSSENRWGKIFLLKGSFQDNPRYFTIPMKVT